MFLCCAAANARKKSVDLLYYLHVAGSVVESFGDWVLANNLHVRTCSCSTTFYCESSIVKGSSGVSP